MSDLGISLDGIRRAESQIETSAKKLARLPVASTSQPGGDVVDLSAETVSMLQGKRVAEANMKALESMDELQKKLIDIFA